MRIVYRLNVVIAFFLLTITFCLGQTNFQEGEIKTLEGTVVNGFVSDEFWKENPTAVKFKNQNGEEFKYMPKDILEFRVGGRIYKSFKVLYDSSSNSSSLLSETFLPNFKAGHFFLRQIIQGDTYTLLELLTVNDRYHYFIQRENSIEELVSHKFISPSTGVISTNKMYIGQLRNLFSNCSSLKVQDDLAYSKSALTDVFTRYFQCVDSKVIVVDNSKSQKSRIEFGVVAKGTFDRFDKFWGWGPGLGYATFLEITSPNRLYKNSLYMELGVQEYAKQEKSYKVNPYPQTFTQGIDPRSIKFLLGYKRRVADSKIQPYLSTGLGFHLINTVNVSGVPSSSAASVAPSGTTILVYSGLGLRLKGFTSEARCEIGASGYLSFQIAAGFTILGSAK